MNELGRGPGDDAFTVAVTCQRTYLREVVEFFWIDLREVFRAELLDEILSSTRSGFAGVVPAFPGENQYWVGEVGKFLDGEVR